MGPARAGNSPRILGWLVRSRRIVPKSLRIAQFYSIHLRRAGINWYAASLGPRLPRHQATTKAQVGVQRHRAAQRYAASRRPRPIRQPSVRWRLTPLSGTTLCHSQINVIAAEGREESCGLPRLIKRDNAKSRRYSEKIESCRGQYFVF